MTVFKQMYYLLLSNLLNPRIAITLKTSDENLLYLRCKLLSIFISHVYVCIYVITCNNANSRLSILCLLIMLWIHLHTHYLIPEICFRLARSHVDWSCPLDIARHHSFLSAKIHKGYCRHGRSHNCTWMFVYFLRNAVPSAFLQVNIRTFYVVEVQIRCLLLRLFVKASVPFKLYIFYGGVAKSKHIFYIFYCYFTEDI